MKIIAYVGHRFDLLGRGFNRGSGVSNPSVQSPVQKREQNVVPQ
jgi:hypothetical protein